MASRHYFLLASLPHLDAIDETPPVSPAEFLQRVVMSEGPVQMIETILLSDDLLQRDALQAGEITEPDPAVLTLAELNGDAPLPDYLAGSGDALPGSVTADVVWRAYFRHAATVAPDGTFLAAWVAWEIALRNALAESRAKALDLDVETYLVAADLGDKHADFTALLNELAVAGDPLTALQAVDRARWDWLDDHSAWFTFGDDELAVYAARLMLMGRAHRLAKAQAAKEEQQEQPAT